MTSPMPRDATPRQDDGPVRTPCPMCWGHQTITKERPGGLFAAVDCPLCQGAGYLAPPRPSAPPAVEGGGEDG